MRTVDYHSFKVNEALEQLLIDIELTRKTKDKTLELIVGYGSKTGNHKIKTAILEKLLELKTNNKIKNYITGNECDIFSKVYLNFSDRNRIPSKAKSDCNPGVIYIFL